MDDCLDSLGSPHVFTTLDVTCGYWEVLMDDRAKALTMLTTHEGPVGFTWMTFGSINAPANFQRTKDIILSRVKW